MLMTGSFSLSKPTAVASSVIVSGCLKRAAFVSVSLPRGSGMIRWDGVSTVMNSPPAFIFTVHPHSCTSLQIIPEIIWDSWTSRLVVFLAM